MKKLLYTLLSTALFGSIANAQITGSDCFLKGTYVEVGLNSCGVYGSVPAPPDGYHPNAGGLGFVADSDQDGWDVGTPNYCGDYFVPGAPVEGWQIQIGSDVYTNTDNGCATDEIPGDITEYFFEDDIYTAVWEGDISDYDLHITQTTTLPLDALYFVTRVLLCNDGTEDINDLYYERNVDPDQESILGGGATTYNEVIFNPPADEKALVISEGLLYGCYLGIGAKDPNARVSYGNFSTTDGTPEDVFEGTGGYSISGSETGDIANQVSIFVESITPGTCRCVAFAYVLNEEDLDEALEATASYNVLVNGEVVPGSEYTAVCEPGGTVDMEIVGADTSYEWTWFPSLGLDTDTGKHVIATVTDSVTYTAIGVGGFCGDATIIVNLMVDDFEKADAGDDEDICAGLSTTLHGDGGIYDSIYSWSPALGLDDPNIAEPVASPSGTVTYTLTTTDQFGCSAVDEITITVNPLPDVNAGSDGQFCIDGEYQLEATGAETYVWTPTTGLSDPNIANPVSTVDEGTTYTVTGTDANGCINTDDVSLTVDLLPDVTAVADPYSIDAFLGETSQLNVLTGGEIFSWEPPTGLSSTTIQNPVANPMDTTIYVVTVTDKNGCVNSDTVIINAKGEITIDFPNAFSPNGDGLNDTYYPIIQGSGVLINYQIFNRWGEMVYEGVPGTSGWDGTFNGSESAVGSYAITINAATSLGEKKFEKGYFTLVR